jgi:hypothetical protein
MHQGRQVRGEGRRVADKQLPTPQHATIIKTQKSIGQAQYREGREGSPDNAPEDLTTLFGIADHRIQTLRLRNPVLQLLPEPGRYRRSDSPTEPPPSFSPPDGPSDSQAKHNN